MVLRCMVISSRDPSSISLWHGLSIGTFVYRDSTSKLTITSLLLGSRATISIKCFEFLTNVEVVPIRGEVRVVTNLGEPMADTMGLKGLSGLN